jgi:hypothetical protein
MFRSDRSEHPFRGCWRTKVKLSSLTIWNNVILTGTAPQSALFQRVPRESPSQSPAFRGVAAHMFGPPNDEAFRGHPLAARGLHPYGVFRIENSSWIRKLERMNSVHRQHRPERYRELQHLVFAFHDSTFECVCRTFTVTQTSGSITGIVPEMISALRLRDA